MEAFTKLRKVVPCGIRLLSTRYSTINCKKGSSTEDTTENLELPFSRDGDSGFTLARDVLLPKDDRIFDAIGNTDELLSHLGVARENAILSKHPYIDKLTRIQTMLVDIVLTIGEQDNRVAFAPLNTTELEEWIVQYSSHLPPVEKYVLPDGGKAATSLHVARSICRRAERSVSPLVKEGYLDGEVQVYLNRLADLLFTWARYAAKRDERSESVYIPKVVGKKDL